MAHIQKRGPKRWVARYIDPEVVERAESFTKKTLAESFLTNTAHDIQTGSYIDPRLGKVTLDTWAKQWLAGQAHLKPSTRERYAGIIREHIEPRWGTVHLNRVRHAQVQAWVSDLAARLSPATVHKIHRVLSLLLASAMKDGRLARNNATGVNLPRVGQAEHRYLTHQQVRDLADQCATPPPGRSKHAPKVESWPADYPLIVLFLAYTGARWGEMAALRVRRVDFLRRRALIAESVTVVKGVQTWGTPKGHLRREVPIPAFLIAELAEHVKGKAPDDLVFSGAKGGALRSQVFQRSVLSKAAETIGVPGLHPHELRHTAASLAIASGADVKVVQTMLGHRSATMTLDLYGHLFGDRLDEVADALDRGAARAVSGAATDKRRTGAELINLPLGRETATPPGIREA